MSQQTDAWEQGDLLFGRMWEDPRAELRLLQELPRGAQVMCVASAGDMALRLAAEPVEVDAVDLNPAQIHLCLLKQAMLLGLSRQEFAESLGLDAQAGAARILSGLPLATQDYWQKHRSKLKRGLHLCGRVDRMMETFRRLFRQFIVSSTHVDELLSEVSLKRQSEIFEAHWQSWRWDFGLRISLNRILLTLIYGRNMVERLPADYRQQMVARMQHFLTASPASQNPFLWQTFGSTKPRTPLPYMAKHGVVNFVCSDMTKFLVARPQRYDLLVFSNILEVSSDEERRALMDSITHSAKPGAILCFRFMMDRPPITRRFHLDWKLTGECRSLDRAFFCNQFQIYRV